MFFKNVKKTMIDQEFTVTKLAKVTGYTRAHLSHVINGHVKSPRAQRVISLALKKDFRELWRE